ncbi:hypothetical protein ACVDG8_005260 [Mesorhizobium sp. ORM8.1]
MKTPDPAPFAIKPPYKASKAKSARLAIRHDEDARRKVADTDGTVRRARVLAERNRLI